MKTFINRSTFLFALSFLFAVAGVTSCKKDDNNVGAPTVDRVRTISKTDTIAGVSHPVNFDSVSVYDDMTVVAFDSTVTSGERSHQYAIIGANLASTTTVSFNGLSVYFNPGLVTDHSIIVTIPATTPYGSSQSNKLTVTTLYGSVDYNFSIQQPPPTITSFDPLAGSAGDILTITGSVFDDVSKVTFDSTVAEIVSSTTTSIQVKIPDGIVQAFIYVTTPGGTTKSTASYGFKSVLFDDALRNGWGNYTGYGSTLNFMSTDHVKRGANDISVTVDNGYGALQIGYGGATINVQQAGLTAIKFSVYGGDAIKDGDKAHVVINGDYNDYVEITLKAGAYTDYTIPLSQLGNPANITEFVVQMFGVAAPSTVYFDDIGFI